MIDARLAGLAAAALVGCACGGPQPVARHASSGPTRSVAAYDVHEWGLVRALPGDVLGVGAIAPPVRVEVLSVDKPVLYFHADAPLTLTSVRVSVPAGDTIREVWPLVPFDATAEWRDVALDPATDCAVSALPTRAEAPCSTLPAAEQCESESLALVRTTDTACLRVGATTERFLFYRARATQFTPPLVFTRTAVYEQVEVRNEGDAVIPGLLIRLSSSGGTTRALAVSPPGPHGSVLVGDDFVGAAAADRSRDVDSPAADDESGPPSSIGPGVHAVVDTMRGIGLTASEADAFLRAWSAALFGVGSGTPVDGRTVDVLTADGTTVDGEPAPRESFLYFLPEPTVAGLSALELDPPARAVHRAIAVWSPLRPVGSSH